MNAGTRVDHDLFAPTMPGGRKRAIALAVAAHLALLAALTWGVNWKTSADQPMVEAELWSAVPQQAAPHPVAPPPPPPPPPAPVPQPAPVPAPPPPKVQEPPQPSEADIALEREKKRKEEEKKHQAELAAQQRAQAEKAKAEQEEKQKQQALAAQQAKAKADKEKADKAKAEQAAKAAEQEKQRKLAEDKRKADEKRKAEADAKRAEALRQDQLKRMQSLAAATGTADQTSSPRQGKNGGSGHSPSPGYGGLVEAKVKPNIVFPDAISGNPRAEVQVQASPDGTIVNVRLTTSSGNAAWDDAVVRALYKTETLPRDVDGRVPSSLIIDFRPKD